MCNLQIRLKHFLFCFHYTAWDAQCQIRESSLFVHNFAKGTRLTISAGCGIMDVSTQGGVFHERSRPQCRDAVRGGKAGYKAGISLPKQPADRCSAAQGIGQMVCDHHAGLTRKARAPRQGYGRCDECEMRPADARLIAHGAGISARVSYGEGLLGQHSARRHRAAFGGHRGAAYELCAGLEENRRQAPHRAEGMACPGESEI